MHSTPASLLERLRHADEQAAWERFALLYTPLLTEWAGRLGLRGQDADDLVQEVFALLVLQLPGTEIERPLAVVMIGGLVTSTLFTLLVLPTFYLQVHGWLQRRSAGASESSA